MPDSTASTDRLVYTLFLATLFHGVLIMGVSFRSDTSALPGASPLEVVIVSARDPDALDDPQARYLARAAQRARGESSSDEAPQSRLSDAAAIDNPGLEDNDSPFQTEPGRPVETDELMVSPSPSQRRIHSVPDATEQPFERSLQARLMHDAPASTVQMEGQSAGQARDEDLRELVVSVATRESVVADYLDTWKRKVERVGTLHFPDAARREGLSGSPVLEVRISADGGLREIRVVRPSPHAVLDQAALRILRLAAPFEPFPEPLRAEYDVLSFVYEWQFIGGTPAFGRLALPNP